MLRRPRLGPRGTTAHLSTCVPGFTYVPIRSAHTHNTHSLLWPPEGHALAIYIMCTPQHVVCMYVCVCERTAWPALLYGIYIYVYRVIGAQSARRENHWRRDRCPTPLSRKRRLQPTANGEPLSFLQPRTFVLRAFLGCCCCCCTAGASFVCVRVYIYTLVCASRVFSWEAEQKLAIRALMYTALVYMALSLGRDDGLMRDT